LESIQAIIYYLLRNTCRYLLNLNDKSKDK
jgi:hypothetical protein